MLKHQSAMSYLHILCHVQGTSLMTYDRHHLHVSEIK